MFWHAARAYKRIVPEVIQTSAMDCGPASLKSLLAGFDIPVDYESLRETCQTDVDGTCIDSLEEIAGFLGLEAEQKMIPADHILLKEARSLPAIVLTRLPRGATHFIVVWSRHGTWVQVMDPATGRRWVPESRLLSELYLHRHLVAATDWRDWAGSEDFILPLQRRLADLGLSGPEITRRIEEASVDSAWTSLSALDATTRMVESIVVSGGLKRGRGASKVHEALLNRTLQRQSEDLLVPRAYWSVWPGMPAGGVQRRLWMQGAVLIAVRGTSRVSHGITPKAGVPPQHATSTRLKELGTVCGETPGPVGGICKLIRADGLLAPTLLAATAVVVAAGVLLEAILLRACLELMEQLALASHRFVAVTGITAVLGALCLLDLSSTMGLFRLGRHLEIRFRIAFLEKLPHLGTRYIGSRLTSDIAERCHNIHQIRVAGRLGGQLLRSGFEFLFTGIGIVWLDPEQAHVTLPVAALIVALPLFSQPLLVDGDLRVRSHNGALSRFYLDTLLGLTPIRTHSAERPLRRAHEELLAEWTRAGLYLNQVKVWVEGIQLLVGFGLAGWLVLNCLGDGSRTAPALLLIYWTLHLPIVGQRMALSWAQVPRLRNVTTRLLDFLRAAEDEPPTAPLKIGREENRRRDSSGATVVLEAVDVIAGGRQILREIDLKIDGGTHVAVVGPSGAGKSSLVGLLLGWYRAAQGRVLVDGERLDDHQIQRLRQQTAWVDPGAQIWNRTLLENLLYGTEEDERIPIAQAMEMADLKSLLPRLPAGMQTPLGEGGGILSGGEGQRVRLGRAFQRPEARLVVLDEACRGLDRQQRLQLLARCRDSWRHATLIWITHDVPETLEFDRVVVMAAGSIVEDGAPKVLFSQRDSYYRTLLSREDATWKNNYRSSDWRRLLLRAGETVEEVS